MERKTVDANILSVKENLIPPASDYSQSGDFIKYRPNTAVNSFGTSFNQTLDIIIEKDPELLIDFSRSYYNIDYYVRLRTGAGAVLPLPINSTFTPVENFLDTLFSNISTSGYIDSSVFWAVDNQSCSYVSGQYRLLMSKKKVVNAGTVLLADLDPGAHSTEMSLPVEEVEDPWHLSIPGPFVDPDIWTAKPTEINTANQASGVIKNPNAVYRNQNAVQLRNTTDYGDPLAPPNRNYQVRYRPYHPLFQIDRKMPLLSNLTVTLRRAPNFTVSYQGSPAYDVDSAAPDVNASYEIVFNNIEFWASVYRPRPEVMSLLNEIKLANKLDYKISRVYSIPSPVTSQNFQQTLNVGSADLLLVAVLRNQQYSGTTEQTAANRNGVNDKRVPVMASAPRATGYYPDVLGVTTPSGPPLDEQLVTLPISSIQVTTGGVQIPQVQPYSPDMPTTTPPAPPNQGQEIALYDRAYQIFVEQVSAAGYGGMLKNISKNEWSTYLRIYAFNISGGDYSSFETTGTLLQLRKQVQVNINFANTSPIGGNANNVFTVMAVAYSNQAIIHINPDNTTNNYF